MSDEIKNTEEMETPDMPEESMADYEAELEASFKKIREGDILTGTVISEIFTKTSRFDRI